MRTYFVERHSHLAGLLLLGSALLGVMTACGGSKENGGSSGSGAGIGAGTNAGTGESGAGSAGAGGGTGGTGGADAAGGGGAAGSAGDGAAGGGVGSALVLAQVSSASRDTCGADTNGSIWCWGVNSFGELFGEPKAAIVPPTRMGADTDWSSVVTADGHHCAIKTSGELSCWGDSAWDSIGSPGQTGFIYPPMQVALAGPFSAVSSHYNQVCALKQGAIYCWGTAQGINSLRDVPMQIGSDTDWKAIATGTDHACALKESGALYCWGDGGWGQLGQGGPAPTTDANIFDPIRVGADMDWTAVAAGEAHSCAIKGSGGVYCWGRNFDSALGDGTTAVQTAPVQAGNVTNWTALSLGGDGSCAINADGELWCWGYIATFLRPKAAPGVDDYSALRVGADHTWKSVAVGIAHACALTSGGETHCWGGNKGGELGDASGGEHAGLFAVTTGTQP